MNEASDYLENKVLDHIFGKAAYTAPANLYIALCTAAPTDASTGSTLTEANYTGYARKQSAPADWSVSSGGTLSNSNVLEFAPCTAGSSAVSHFAIVDAAANGNVLFYGTCTLAVSTGIIPRFAAGALIVSAT
jgi:hypothetical protein